MFRGSASRCTDFSDVDRLALRDALRLERDRSYRQPPAWVLRALNKWRRLTARTYVARGIRPRYGRSMLRPYKTEAHHGPA
jgi:hypothetical protein